MAKNKQAQLEAYEQLLGPRSFEMRYQQPDQLPATEMAGGGYDFGEQGPPQGPVEDLGPVEGQAILEEDDAGYKWYDNKTRKPMYTPKGGPHAGKAFDASDIMTLQEMNEAAEAMPNEKYWGPKLKIPGGEHWGVDPWQRRAPK